MSARIEEKKRDAINAALSIASPVLNNDESALMGRFMRQFYSAVPADYFVSRSAEHLHNATLSLWRFMETRVVGHAKLRVINPRFHQESEHFRHTVIEIVNDDMPFLLDSVITALSGDGYTVSLVIHPILDIERNARGKITGLSAADTKITGVSRRESIMHIEIAEERDPGRLVDLAAVLERVLDDVRIAVSDWGEMRDRLSSLHQELADQPTAPAELSEIRKFLAWLDDDNFTFLGVRDYRFGDDPAQHSLNIVKGSGLGILREEAYPVFGGLRQMTILPASLRQSLQQKRPVVLTKSNRRSTVHRLVLMDAICIPSFDTQGNSVGVTLFLGLFTSLAYSRNARTIPLVRRKIDAVIARSSFDPASHDGKALAHILDTYPRDELFQISEDELYETAVGIFSLQERPRIALFLRRDPFERFVSCLVYVPRERYDTGLRRRFAAILQRAFAGTIESFSTQIEAEGLDRVHFVLRTTSHKIPSVDLAALEQALIEAGRSWSDRLNDALETEKGEKAGTALWQRYSAAFPTSYRERFSAGDAIQDIDRLEALRSGSSIVVSLYRAPEAVQSELRLKIYRAGTPVALSDVLPMLEHLGLKVIAEIPYGLNPRGTESVWIQDFSLTSPGSEVDIGRDHARFEDAFLRLWEGRMESDGINRLVLAAGFTWRQVVVLRLYVKFLRQAGSAYSQAYMEDVLATHANVAKDLITLFERRFDPADNPNRREQMDALVASTESALDSIQNLDEDRMLRAFLLLICQSLRTNYYQHSADGSPKPYLSIKFSSSGIDLLPLPRPMVEIYVLSPRIEGVHLRGGKVARGGIRWSDRKEDFRTEILGLMKAQIVKNAVIVPTGSKGGFVVKRPPADQADQLSEGIDCYKIFLSGLLDLTDNIVGKTVAPPPDLVRHDGDDSYLVVAADKGTASFSDIANGVAADYGYWLGDAFASGGSAGYDHKAMGITARGAWETVARHFREQGTDIDTTDFSVVGVGDMSGDVFGNGMLRTPHINLIAAFDHRHIFLDPAPDIVASFAERKRLFGLPRSSWADYDKSLISAGGGVFGRDLKSIPLSLAIRTLLAIDAERLTAAALIQAILRAPVELLWFGGIGTYVKARAEHHGDVGDRANDQVRVDAEDLRAAIIGEGANLGVTQNGRIAYALNGGRINTDAIDNSAGVDTSDHEVNLKILLGDLVSAGDLTLDARNTLLQDMTDVIAAHVLADNDRQALALSLAEAQGIGQIDQQFMVIHALERTGDLNRAVEFLPDDKALSARVSSGHGLTRPELAVLMAYVKNHFVEELLASDLPDAPELERFAVTYFPARLAEQFPNAIKQHRLRREIVATALANEIVNRGGITFVTAIRERTGRPVGRVGAAYVVAQRVFGLDTLWESITGLEDTIPTDQFTNLLLRVQTVLEHGAEWFLRHEAPTGIGAQIDLYAPAIASLMENIASLLPEFQRSVLENRIIELSNLGIHAELSAQIAKLDLSIPTANIVLLSLADHDTPPEGVNGFAENPSSYVPEIHELALRFFDIGSRLRLDALRLAIRRMRINTAWQKLAAGALIDDLYALQANLTRTAIYLGDHFEPWLKSRTAEFVHLDGLIHEVETTVVPDLAMLSVATRGLIGLATTDGPTSQ